MPSTPCGRWAPPVRSQRPSESPKNRPSLRSTAALTDRSPQTTSPMQGDGTPISLARRCRENIRQAPRNHYPAALCEKRSNPADHPGKFALFVPGRRSGGDVSIAGTPASLGGGGHRRQTESGVECEDYKPAKYRHGSDLADRWNAQKSCVTVSMRGAESGAPLCGSGREWRGPDRKARSCLTHVLPRWWRRHTVAVMPCLPMAHASSTARQLGNARPSTAHVEGRLSRSRKGLFVQSW